jgi:hypothetical protein
VVDALAKVFLKLGGFEGMIKSIKKKFGDLGKKFKLAKDIAIPLLIGALATLTAMAVALGVALLPVIWPFLLFGGIIVAVVAAFRALEERFGFMDKAVGFLVEAFQTFKHGIGQLLIDLGNTFGVPDVLAEWGHALQDSAALVRENRKIEAAAKAKGSNIDNMSHTEVMGALNTQLKDDKKALGLTEDIKDATEETARNTTIDIKTNPEFLDQTANMLGRSIESILGITKDNSAAEIVEELRALNQQTAVLVEKPDPEGAPATAS